MYDDFALQYTTPNLRGECELVIGLDFGTSTTKVVIQAPELQGQPARAIDFGQLSPLSASFLLPSKIWVAENGLCKLHKAASSHVISDIKVELFQRAEFLRSSHGASSQKHDPEVVAVAYLALVLRYSRKWFLRTQKHILGNPKRIIWSLNLGVPSPCIEENEENRCFRRIGMGSWMMSLLPEDMITITRIGKELERVQNPDYWNDDNPYACDFDIIPEIAAGAVGYAFSQYQRNGLHVVVDVGAGTVDVCVFMLHGNRGNNRYALFTADVQPLGTLMYHTKMSLAIAEAGMKHAKILREGHELIQPLQTSTEHYLISREKMEAEVLNTQNQFKKRLIVMVRRLIWYTKQRRCQNDQAWNNFGSLPILIIGGGSASLFYRLALESLDEWSQGTIKNNGIRIIPTIIPNLIRDGSPEYLTVAWGLSHRALDIGEIIPPDKISDIEKLPKLDVDDLYVGKDQV